MAPTEMAVSAAAGEGTRFCPSLPMAAHTTKPAEVAALTCLQTASFPSEDDCVP
jgi:hypothetical protein